jgi:epoxyqueuosine reductase
METAIKEFALTLGIDDVGFALACDYHNPKSYPITQFLPEAKSILVLAFKVLSNCESPSTGVAYNGYLDAGAFARTASYRISRFLESRFNAKIAAIPGTLPMEIRSDKPGIAEFSHRHAAVAAGLGTFGRHNLVIHPKFGTRVMFASIVTDLILKPSPKCTEKLCTHCNLCVENCPGRALDEPGRTDLMKCLAHSQPYSRKASIEFWIQLLGSTPERQKELLASDHHARLSQALHLGNQYCCFNCMKLCPVGQ